MVILGRLQCARGVQKPFWTVRKQWFSSTYIKRKELEFSDVEIPVPWGFVSGKWWGRQDVQPVLALHGVQDNAATFDRLAPLLHVDALLALDMPGHGWSSPTYPGFSYDFLDGVSVMRFVAKHFYKWEKPLVLLGHSFGSYLSYVYSALYPDQVSKYISIDCARHQMALSPGTMLSAMRETVEKTLKFEEKSKPPEYTYDQLLERFYQGRNSKKGKISLESCKVLLSRGIRTLDNGKVYLSRDIKITLNAFGRHTHETVLELAPMIKCDVLSVQAEMGTVRNDIKGDLYRQTVDIMLSTSPISKHVILPGYHHLHLDDPEPVAEEINKFLSI